MNSAIIFNTVSSNVNKKRSSNESQKINRNNLKAKITFRIHKKDADIFLSTFMETVKKGDDVSLVGFGSWTKTRIKAREGRNLSTDEKIKISATTKANNYLPESLSFI